MTKPTASDPPPVALPLLTLRALRTLLEPDDTRRLLLLPPDVERWRVGVTPDVQDWRLRMAGDDAAAPPGECRLEEDTRLRRGVRLPAVAVEWVVVVVIGAVRVAPAAA